MPIYEYKGQQYDIATDDPTAAKAKILKYIGTQEPAPAKETAEAEPSLGSPMGTGLEEILAAAQPNRERKTYTGSVFDTQPFEPSPRFNPAEAARLSNRAYAEDTTRPPRRTQYATATPQNQLERSTGQAVLDTVIGALQGAAGMPKSIAANINAGDNPVANFFDSAVQAGERSKSPYLQNQKAQREAFIKNVGSNQGELASTRATFNSMFSPAGADVVVQGVGSMIPTVGMSLLKVGQLAMGAVNALSVAGETAQNTAQKLSQMSPEDWSNSNAYQELRNSGMPHKDAVNMLAPLFALPNQALGFLIGGVSGVTGLEKTLAGKSVKGGARERAARAGSELLGEEAETLIPSFAANITRLIFDDKQSLVEGLGREAVETAFGTAPGAALAASGRAGKPTTQTLVNRPDVKSEPVAETERVEPTFDEAAFDKSASPASPVAPTVAQPVALTEQIKVVAERLQTRGISRKTALAMAQKEVADELAQAETGEPTNVAGVTVGERVEPAALTPVKTEEDYASKSLEELQTLRDSADQTNDALDLAAIQKHFGNEAAAAYEKMSRSQRNKWWDANATEALERDSSVFTGINEETIDEYIKAHNNFDTESPRALGRSVGLLAGKIKAPDFIGSPDFVTLKNALAYARQQNFSEAEVLSGMRERASEWAGTDAQELFKELFQKKPSTETEGTTTDGIETSQTQQTKQEEQEAPATGAVAPGKPRGRPPVQQRHAVVKTPEGKYEHVTDGEVTATYDTQRQATAAVNLAKAQDANNPTKIAKFQSELDVALAAKGKGRPPNAPTADGTVALNDDTRQEMGALESALETYNSPASKDSIANAAAYISDAAVDTNLPAVVRERAQQMLENDVDPKDIPKKLRSTDGNVGKGDTGFNSAANGAEAITRVIKTGNAFQRFVAGRIRNFLSGVKFVVLEKGDTIPDGMEGARGLFVYDLKTKERTVYVRGASFGGMQGINNITVLHEMLHAATASRITAGLLSGFRNAQLQKFIREMQTLMRAAEDAYRLGVERGTISNELQDLVEAGNIEFDDQDRPKFEIFKSPYEFLAYGMSSPEFQKFLMGVKGVRKEPTLFSGFVSGIRDLFGVKEGESTAFTDLVDITDKMLGTRVTPTTAQGEISLQQKAPLTDEEKAQREKERAVTRAIEAVERSFEAEAISEATTVLQRLRSLDVVPVLKEIAKGLGYKQKQAISKALSTPLVAEIGGINVPELINTNILLEQMDAAKMEMLRAGAKFVDDIKRLVPTEASREKISYAGLVFTASRIDPRVDKSVVRLNKIYDALTDNEKKALDEIVGYYVDMKDNYAHLLEESVKALQPKDASKLTTALQELLGKDSSIPFYLPLAREQNGKFYLRVGRTEFHTRKTLAERDRLAEAIAKERGSTVQQLLEDQDIEVGDDIEVLRKKVLDSSDTLREIFKMVEDADFKVEGQDTSARKAKDGLKDSVFQLWLHMQPESSSRKQFIHRSKFTPAGFRTDLIRNLSESVLKFSNNMSKLEYAPQLRRSISQANSSIENRSEFTPYVAEMALRVNDTLAPNNESTGMGIARFGNSFTFGYYMSESTALLQLLSVYQVGTAQLAKQYPMAAVAKEVAKMIQVWNTIGVKNEYGEWVMPTIETALNLNIHPTDSAKVRLDKEQDRALIDAMHERNVSESTGARDLQGYKDLPTEKYGSKYEQAKRIGRFVVGGLIHSTERLSREFMFMSSAHLVRDKAVAEFHKTAEYKNAPDKIAAERAFGEANMDTWADKAAKDTNAALFNYSESAKPRYMRGPLGRIALQFFTYQLNVGSFIARNFIGMIKPLPGETRVECMRAFSTLMATTFTLGGTSALFGGPIVIGFLSLIMKTLKGADEPDELKDLDLYERFKIFLQEQLGDVTVGGKSLAKIFDQGPLNAFTGLDVSSRTSVSNILTPPEIKAAKTTREGVLNYAELYGGANLQAVLALSDGVDLLIKGEQYRGFEKLMPWAFARNKMTAFRQATEGEKGLKLGDDVVAAELFYTGELIGQAVGLRPVLLSDVTAANRKAREILGKVEVKRASILDRLDRADRKGDDKAYLEALEDQQKFNAKVSLEFPRMQITEENRYNFIKGRNEARRTSFGGFQYTPQNEVIAEQITERSRKALVEREKAIADRKAEKNPR